MKNNDYLLTIAIPTYNRKELLKRALSSIIPQLNSKIEVLVSDNASDDGTDELISSEYPMVRYIKNNINMGVDNNFLQCYREAKGKYVMLLGSDDRFANGAIDYLTDFLEKNTCDLTFINFRFYDVTKKDIYINDGEWIKNYKDKSDILTNDRNQFIMYAGHTITFMSALVAKRSIIMDVAEPEHFIGTHFIHACIMLEAVKGKDARFGIITHPLIEANATAGDSEISKAPEQMFTIFGKYMYYVLCVHAVECGFSRKYMRNSYFQFIQNWWKLIIKSRFHNDVKVMNDFWKDGYPVVKHFPSVWVKVVFAAFIPRFAVNMICKFHYTYKFRYLA